MTTFYDKIIKIISKPSESREDEEVLMILAWFLNLFKKKSAVFGDIEPDVVKDIIKNCTFETKKIDDIIIRQGDVGDCFYITLRGKVSIYINQKKYDDPDYHDPEDSSSFEDNSSTSIMNMTLSSTFRLDDTITIKPIKTKESKELREKLGNYVTSLGPGEGFGEVALISEDTRTASIIADEPTDLMVVNKALYSRCLQATTLRKLAEKQNFINNSPFFGNWQPKMKKLLSLCLERDIVPYDSYLGKQGEPSDRMFFIISGQAKITVNPSMHKRQYSRMYPLRLPEVTPPYSDKTTTTATSKKLKNIGIKRRNESFAEAEQRLKIRNLEIGILGPGEVGGMCEILFDMGTLMQSTKCLQDCDVFYIYRRSYDRLIARRNPTCVAKMKDHVYMKLTARNNRLSNIMPLDLFRSIQYLIELSRKKEEKRELSAARSQSQMTFPQRGAFVQLDNNNNRPKLNYFNRLMRQSNNRISRNEFNSDSDKLLIQQQQQQQQLLPQIEPEVDSKDFLVSKVIVNNEEANNETVVVDVTLNELEDKMKKWQLDLGCKKAFVTKLNRVDIDNAKNVKFGGNVYIKRVDGSNRTSKSGSEKKQSNGKTRSRSDSNYSENSSDNASENEAIGYFKLKSDSKLLSQSQNILALHLQREAQATTNDAALKTSSTSNVGDDFLKSFFNYMNSTTVEADVNNKEAANKLTKSLLANYQVEPASSCISFMPAGNNEENGLSCTLVSPSYLNYYTKSKDMTKRLDETTDGGGEGTNGGGEVRIRSHHRTHNSSSYIVNRKFSMGQIKIQHTGKQYSKEEYAALRDELKKQTRRYSMISSN